MRIVVAGAGGYLGSAVLDLAPGRGIDAVATGRRRPDGGGPDAWAALDVRNRTSVRDALEGVRPDVVVNTAFVASGTDAAPSIVGGAVNLASECASRGIGFVHVSTDAVFSGASVEPHDEGSAPDPVSTYGLLKAQAEVEVSAAHPAAAIVRTSLLWGGAARPGAQEAVVVRAAAGDDITFFTDEIRCPVHVLDVAAALVSIAEHRLSGVFHVAGPDALDRLTLASHLARHIDVDPTKLRGAPTPSSIANRPRAIVVSCERHDTEIGGRRRSVRDTPGSDRNEAC